MVHKCERFIGSPLLDACLLPSKGLLWGMGETKGQKVPLGNIFLGDFLARSLPASPASFLFFLLLFLKKRGEKRRKWSENTPKIVVFDAGEVGGDAGEHRVEALRCTFKGSAHLMHHPKLPPRCHAGLYATFVRV